MMMEKINVVRRRIERKNDFVKRNDCDVKEKDGKWRFEETRIECCSRDLSRKYAREDTELRARDVRERELQAAAEEKERLKREEQQKKSERLRRASKKMEKILPKMTTDGLEIPMYFKTVENYFHEFEVEDDP